jgi:L-amino acid N-acyltransferase YncA
MLSSENFKIRDATPEDVPQINAIYNHYVDHTIVTFALSRMRDDEMLSKLRAVLSVEAGNLPFLVAEMPSPVNASGEMIVGYVYLYPYRPDRLAYQYTVELSIYIHSDYRNMKLGTPLMDHILERAKKTKVREILAVMSINVDEKDGGLWLRDWYGRWGFEQAGRLKKVGLKFNIWSVPLQIAWFAHLVF